MLKKEAQQLEAEKKAFNAELQKVTRHRNEIASHLDAVQAKLSQVEAAVADARKRNQFYASEIARLQLDAIRRIDERTRRRGNPRHHLLKNSPNAAAGGESAGLTRVVRNRWGKATWSAASFLPESSFGRRL